VRVALLYWTVEQRDDGALLFYPDVYQRDRRPRRIHCEKHLLTIGWRP
jgi:murein L,D-transpeptidase YcbB/YkuD